MQPEEILKANSYLMGPGPILGPGRLAPIAPSQAAPPVPERSRQLDDTWIPGPGPRAPPVEEEKRLPHRLRHANPLGLGPLPGPGRLTPQEHMCFQEPSLKALPPSVSPQAAPAVPERPNPEDKRAPLLPGMGVVGPGPGEESQTPTMADDEVEDSPGMYVITHNNTFVSEDARIPPSEHEVRHRLEEGREIRVLEVVQVPEQNRVRARIQNPPGWISLKDVKLGHRWANKKVDSEEELQAMQAEIQDAVQDNDSLHEKVRLLASKMESLRMCNLELASKASGIGGGLLRQPAATEHGGAGCSK